MSTRIVSVGEATVTIRSETRRAALHRARYLKALEAVHPELREMTATYFFDEKDAERRAAYEACVEFAMALSRVVGSENAPVRFPQLIGETLSNEDVIKAYEHYLDDDSAFWARIVNAVIDMDAAGTDLTKQPMTDEIMEKVAESDPNSSPGGENGSAPSGND